MEREPTLDSLDVNGVRFLHTELTELIGLVAPGIISLGVVIVVLSVFDASSDERPFRAGTVAAVVCVGRTSTRTFLLGGFTTDYVG